jgi:hypothetical protein
VLVMSMKVGGRSTSRVCMLVVSGHMRVGTSCTCTVLACTSTAGGPCSCCNGGSCCLEG